MAMVKFRAGLGVIIPQPFSLPHLKVVSSVWLEYPELERTCRFPDSCPLLLDLRGWNCLRASTGDVSDELVLSLPAAHRGSDSRVRAHHGGGLGLPRCTVRSCGKEPDRRYPVHKRLPRVPLWTVSCMGYWRSDSFAHRSRRRMAFQAPARPSTVYVQRKIPDASKVTEASKIPGGRA